MCTLLILAGITAMCQPWWPAGFRIGFFAVLAATIGFTIFARFDVPRGERS